IAVCNFLKGSDYFKIKDIVVINNYVDFPTLKGINIFSLNLKNVSQAIQNKCPDQKLVRVSKVMPNRLIIEFQKRVPLAAVRLDRLYFFDSQGILFEMPQETTASAYPMITGLKISNPRLGVKYNLKDLDDALRLVIQSARLGLSGRYPIKMIDVSNPDYLTFSILNNLKIKIPNDGMQEKLSVFISLISQVNMDLNRVEYIDLRFKDPTIKLKGVNEK
ncbi:MAG: cell division protein FtsQ/DivIB, partial [Candidatus Omnitrophica bacterium]|nr:cell division protein FtsQ/DivIB [Candidatus Omnitrophota bacterium]